MKKRLLILIFSFYMLLPSSYQNLKDQNKYLESLKPGGSTMIFIPKGEYYTGDKGSTDKSPLTKRAFESFYIDIHPVTNSQFLVFIKKTGYSPDGKFDKTSAETKPSHPVTGVTLKDAAGYAEFAGKRLPTEWEWEIAARALKKDYRVTLSMIYKEKKGIFFEMGRKTISPVFSTPPNDIGFYDYIGNIFEWTTSVYPTDLLIGKNRNSQKVGVVRGGAWTNIRNDVKYSTRTPFPVKRSLKWLGFRCVKDPGN